MFTTVNVNGKKINFEIDTGTYATVITEKTFNDYFKELKLVKSNHNLRAYGGHSLEPLGELFDLRVNFNNITRCLKCFVLPGMGPPLIGREWFAQFQAWPLIVPYVNKIAVNKIEGSLHNYLMKKFEMLFSHTPGLYNKKTTKIHLKDNMRPVALKYRQPAHALKPMIEKELERLMSLRHVEPVESSEWATPIVRVLKGNGDIRICGDFKLTLYPNIIIDKYPLYTIDDIFAKLLLFEWYASCEAAFKWVKNELIATNFLAHYDPKGEIFLACDASDYGLSAILSHRYKDDTERPIAYA